MRLNSNIVTYKVDELNLYRKKSLEINFIESIDIADEGTELVIPTLEGEVIITVSSAQTILIGPCDDVYPIPSDLFLSRYEIISRDDDYSHIQLLSKIGWKPRKVGRCRLRKKSFVYAKEMPFDFTVYVKHSESVIRGKSGDYYAMSYEDMDNTYIISGSVMKATYELVR